MSTIATPRDPPRRISSLTQTPTSSNRPSLEANRSVTSSPNPSAAIPPSTASLASPVAGAGNNGNGAAIVKRNRAALREYYNLKKTATTGGTTPTLEVSEIDDDQQRQRQRQNSLASYSEVPPSIMDQPDFDAVSFVRKALQNSGLEELLRTYTRVLSEMRALDAEKKSLVYDNYSRLIAATETIRKMRTNMDPRNPMASTLDPVIAHVYKQARSLRDSMRDSVPAPESHEAATASVSARTRQLAAIVLETPHRLRQLVREGRTDEAHAAWERPRKLLELWNDRGLGGNDVTACLADGEAALRGELAGQPADT